MRLFQVLNNEVIVVKNELFYSDTVENYILDGGIVEKDGEKITIAVHDSQQAYCEINGKVLKYPVDLFENIIDSIDTLLAKKAEREYVPPTFEEIVAAKLSELKSTRDTLETEPIEYNGNRYDYDDKARDRINAAIIALDISGQNIEWTTADNTNVAVTAQDLRNIIAAVALRSNDLHVKYRELKEQVLACTTVEEVAEIVW